MKIYNFIKNRPDRKCADEMLIVKNNNAVILLIADGADGIPFKNTSPSLRMIMEMTDWLKTNNQYNESFLLRAAAKIREIDLDMINNKGGRTSFIMLLIDKGFVSGISCGDSRAYIFEPNEARELTINQDEYLVGELCVPKIIKKELIKYPIIVGSKGFFDPLEIVNKTSLIDVPNIDYISYEVSVCTDHESLLSELYETATKNGQIDDISAVYIIPGI